MINNLRKGSIIVPLQSTQSYQVRGWKYGKECCDIGNGLAPGTRLEVAEVSNIPGRMWVRAALPNTFPGKILKISADEFASFFKAA
jgi:hypothetical protein